MPITTYLFPQWGGYGQQGATQQQSTDPNQQAAYNAAWNAYNAASWQNWNQQTAAAQYQQQWAAYNAAAGGQTGAYGSGTGGTGSSTQ